MATAMTSSLRWSPPPPPTVRGGAVASASRSPSRFNSRRVQVSAKPKNVSGTSRRSSRRQRRVGCVAAAGGGTDADGPASSAAAAAEDFERAPLHAHVGAGRLAMGSAPCCNNRFKGKFGF
jgi:hypothetical protein